MRNFWKYKIRMYAGAAYNAPQMVGLVVLETVHADDVSAGMEMTAAFHRMAKADLGRFEIEWIENSTRVVASKDGIHPFCGEAEHRNRLVKLVEQARRNVRIPA